MGNKKEIYKDDITKLINGKTLDEIIENLQNLKNTCYGCEVIKLKLNSNINPMVIMYDVVNEIPGNIDLTRYPTIPKQKYPTFDIKSLPKNNFMDTTYFKDVYNKDIDGLEEITIINNLKTIFKNSRNRVFIRYGKGKYDTHHEGTIAGFFILNLDSIIAPTVEILVPNKEQVKFLRDGNTAKEFVNEINKEFGFNKVKKIFFKEIL